MNFTLHLTEACNMDCSYCVHEKRQISMPEKVMIAACDLAFSKGTTAGLCFFGGEPLLEKELIYKALDYCKVKEKTTGKRFKCKMTTNGTLLDEEFIMRAKSCGMEIGMSFDGSVQDICRRYADGRGTFADMERKAKILLEELPMSYAMLTIAPQAVDRYAESIQYLHSLGFHRVTGTIAYGRRVNWSEKHLKEMEIQLRKIAEFYSGLFIKGERFYFSPFDSKIKDCITDTNPSEHCHLGLRQMPVAVDGKLYPCTQFIGDEDYCLGDVFTGIDISKQAELISRASEPKECRECDLNRRCTNSCGCMNRLETGSENTVSSLQCTYERMLISICDEMAERLYEQYPVLFKNRYMSVKK